MLFMLLTESFIRIDDHNNNTANNLDNDIACIIENAIKKATKPILTQVAILQKTLDKVSIIIIILYIFYCLFLIFGLKNKCL